MNKGVGSVCPPHQYGILQEPLLDVRLNEDAELLLQTDNLQGVLAGRINRGSLQSDGGEGSSELVDLCLRSDPVSITTPTVRVRAYPVDQRPVPNLHEEGVPPQHPAEEPVLVYLSVRDRDDPLPSSEPYGTLPPGR